VRVLVCGQSALARSRVLSPLILSHSRFLVLQRCVAAVLQGEEETVEKAATKGSKKGKKKK